MYAKTLRATMLLILTLALAACDEPQVTTPTNHDANGEQNHQAANHEIPAGQPPEASPQQNDPAPTSTPTATQTRTPTWEEEERDHVRASSWAVARDQGSMHARQDACKHIRRARSGIISWEAAESRHEKQLHDFLDLIAEGTIGWLLAVRWNNREIETARKHIDLEGLQAAFTEGWHLGTKAARNGYCR